MNRTSSTITSLIGIFVVTVAAMPTTAIAQAVAYVPNFGLGSFTQGWQGDDDVIVIDIATRQRIGSFKVGDKPYGLAPHPVDNAIYVVNQGIESKTSNKTVTKIETVPPYLRTDIPVGLVPYGIAISNDGTRAYVTNRRGNDISILDLQTDTQLDTINIPDALFNVGLPACDGDAPYSGVHCGPKGITMGRGGNNSIWVTNFFDDSIVEIGTNSGSQNYKKIISYVDLSDAACMVDPCMGPREIIFTPGPLGADVLYVTNRNDNSISRVTFLQNTLADLTTLPTLGSTPRGLAISPDQTTLYVTLYESDTIEVYHTQPFSYSGVSIPVQGIKPFSVAYYEGPPATGDELWVLNWQSHDISIIDPVGFVVLETVGQGQDQCDAEGKQGFQLFRPQTMGQSWIVH